MDLVNDLGIVPPAEVAMAYAMADSMHVSGDCT